MKKSFLIIIGLFCASSSTYADEVAPFGFRKGMPISELEALPHSKEDKYYYIVHKPPKTNYNLKEYAVIATPKHGVCFIKASTLTFDTDKYGDDLRNIYKRLETPLKNKYGVNSSLDTLKDGSLWDAPEHWMMGMLKGERKLNGYWSSSAGSDMPVGLKGILLSAKAESLYSARIELSYEFDNFDECTNVFMSKEDDSL